MSGKRIASRLRSKYLSPVKPYRSTSYHFNHVYGKSPKKLFQSPNRKSSLPLYYKAPRRSPYWNYAPYGLAAGLGLMAAYPTARRIASGIYSYATSRAGLNRTKLSGPSYGSYRGATVRAPMNVGALRNRARRQRYRRAIAQLYLRKRTTKNKKSLCVSNHCDPKSLCKDKKK